MHFVRTIHEHLAQAELLISDWSGVISDDRRPVYEANARILESFGKPRTSFQEWLDLSHSSAYAFLSSQGIAESKEFLEALYSKEYGRISAEGTSSTVYPDAKIFLQTLQASGKQVVVVSSHPEEHLLAEANRYGLVPYIESFLGSHADKVPAIRSVLGNTDTQAWYLGDTVFDVQAARLACIPIVSITTGYHSVAMLEQEKPDIIVQSLTELLGHVCP